MMDKERNLRLVRITYWILTHWLTLFLVLFGLFNLLPFVAPVMSKLGFDPVADVIYLAYAPLCHQMAHRSFFLFGDQLMYSPEQLPLNLTADLTTNTLALKHFTGNEMIGWKVAWSDRMVYMYGAMWVFAAVYALIAPHYKVKRISILAFVLLMLPMIADGTTHMLSDFNGGLFGGFRYTNDWLAGINPIALPEWFYVGDKLGSFNAWMRLASGIGFGIATIGLIFPLIEAEMQSNSIILATKLRHYEESTSMEGENKQSYILDK